MSSDRWQQVSRLYHEARVRVEAERAAFVREACAGDEALRREVESLLANESQAAGFLSAPALGVAGKMMSERPGSSVVGQQIGSYHILSLLGAGEMGEVYRARDLKLGRDVAIKILPRLFTTDADRLARFAREARLLAALNHPHIATIHGFEDFDAMPAVVMELVEGPTLADRLTRPRGHARRNPSSPFSLADTLRIAQEIAEALEAAHEKGIIHRDLKPANIKLTRDGSVKVLDFGLAKAFAGDGTGGDLSQTPTVTATEVRVGAIVGTPAYMSPEQARGQAIDKRTDVWAFGCVLYEMLTGRTAFPGDTLTDTLAAILEREPDWSALPESTPTKVRDLLQRCLRKDPSRRLHDVADARIELDEIRTVSATAAVAVPARRLRERLAWGAATLAVVTLGALLIPLLLSSRRAPITPEELRLEVSTPPTSHPAMMALSPDGRRLVFVATAENKTQLFLRDLASTTARPLAGTEGALYPFWSPDSRSVAFFATGKLQRVELSGGPVQTLANAPSPSGGSWNEGATIIFAPVTGAPIMRVSARGGEPGVLTRIDRPRHIAHRAPQFLPDGRHFVYFAEAAGLQVAGAELYLASLDGSESQRLTEATSGAVYVPPGYLLFVRQGTLLAQRFDAGRLQLAGDPVPVAQQVPVQQGVAAVSAVPTGVVAFRTVTPTTRPLAWFDRSGKEVGAIRGLPEGANAFDPELSPDGTRVAVHALGDVWLLDTTRDLATRLTVESTSEQWPVWTPDGRRIIFRSNRGGSYDLYQKLANAAGTDDLLLQTPVIKSPEDVSPDGRFLLFRVLEVKSRDLWALPLQGDRPSTSSGRAEPAEGRKPFSVLNTEFEEREGQFAPDGRWIAYVSNASGRFEVYVQPFPGPGGKWQVSTAGGSQPRWRGDGKELFYLGLDGALTAVPIELAPDGQNVNFGKPAALFSPNIAGGAIPGISRRQYAVRPDGQRFLIITEEEGSVMPITVILNWHAGVNK